MAERIVEVEWEDSVRVHGWHKGSEVLPPAPCRSVGFVVTDDEAGIVLAESLDDSLPPKTVSIEPLGCTITIPRSAIRKVTELRRGKRA